MSDSRTTSSIARARDITGYSAHAAHQKREHRLEQIFDLLTRDNLLFIDFSFGIAA